MKEYVPCGEYILSSNSDPFQDMSVAWYHIITLV